MTSTRLPVRLPLELSPVERSEYVAVATVVLEQTLALYQQHLENPRELDARQWKLLKRKERIAIYASKDKRHATAFHDDNTFPNPTPIQRSAIWEPQSKLRCMGSLLGSVEDAMYGAVTPTEASMVMRSMAIQDEFAEHRTLCDIAVPTEGKPFTYVGLKWSSRTAYLATMVKPRDMTYVEATGFATIDNRGQPERVGYMVYHSMDLPQLPPLTHKGIYRSAFSLAVMYRQIEPGVVEVFSTIASTAAGTLPRKLTTLFSAESLVAVHKVTESAMKKKLVWMRAARIHGAAELTDCLPVWTPPQRQSVFGTTISTCPQCLREFSSLRSSAACFICDTEVCSRCLTARKLVLGRKKSELKYESVSICKGCISTALKMDQATELAIYEFVRPFQSERPSTTTTTYVEWMDASIVEANSLSVSSDWKNDELGQVDVGVRESEELDPVDEVVRMYPSTEQRSDAFSDERLRLWNQMNSLRVQAEQTYRLAKRQTLVMQQQLQPC